MCTTETEAAVVYSCYIRVLVNYSLAVVGGYEGLYLVSQTDQVIYDTNVTQLNECRDRLDFYPTCSVAC